MRATLDMRGAGFIDHDGIEKMLEAGRLASRAAVEEILAEAREAKGLNMPQVAVLLQVQDPDILELMFSEAKEVKEKIYGRRLVLFAPLYISNYCINNCRYCGYKKSNATLARRRLTMDELKDEVVALESMGHKRLALECGEDPVNCPIDYVLEAIETIYDTYSGVSGSIRRVNVNIAATGVKEYRMLKEAGIGTYVLFQETYHEPTYRFMHPSGPKSDYLWHLTAMDRAMEAGLDDVGIGVLFGLYDFNFEVMGIIRHAEHLERCFGVGPHTVSVPRLKPAYGMNLEEFPYLVSDDDFKKIVAILRLALPYTGIILSTREAPAFRDQVIELGVSQISAGSCTGVGAYSKTGKDALPFEDSSQFQVEDHRSPDEVVCSLARSGYIPSYCTACYRSGRTGDRFMQLAKSGKIQYVCAPNALLTFKEYLMDYASPGTRHTGEEAIKEHLQEIPSEALRGQVKMYLERIERGERDLFI